MPFELHRKGSKVFVFDTPEQLAMAAAERFVDCAQEAIGEHGVFSMALAGGRTPGRVYELLATEHSSNVHRIIGEGAADANAQSYETELKSFFAGLSSRFDLVLLGMGEDGHTGAEALNETTRWPIKTRMERSKQDRITLTIPVFNHAAHAISRNRHRQGGAPV